MNVTIVDDESSTLEFVTHVLSQEGISVEGFTSVPDDFIFHKPDLIILDVYMYEKSGIDICKEIKSNNKFKNTPVVMLSGSHDVKDKILAMEAGALDYLEKPITKEILLTSIKKYIHIGKIFNSLDSMADDTSKTNLP